MPYAKTFATLVLLITGTLPSWAGAELVCDTNDDSFVDIDDIRAILSNRNQPAASPDDPMDWDRSGVIDVLDARACVLACSLPRCAQQPVVNTNCVLGSSRIGACTI